MGTCRYKRLFQTLSLYVVLSLSVLPHAFAQTPSHSPRQKKLIEAGWDKPDTATLRKNLSQMEQSPFDGVIVEALGKSDDGKTIKLSDTFSNVSWKRAWFQSSVDDLKAIDSKKLTDNFLQVGTNPGNLDWFDDAGWKQIVDHWRIAAWVAKEGNLKGLMFDPEAYTPPHHQFDHATQPQHNKHTFDEYEAKARQRGKEIISAIAAVDPNLVIFTFFMNSFNVTASKTPYPKATLQLTTYGLYPAFINGWLDAAPPSMIFVDGCELAYYYNSELDYLKEANLMRTGYLNLVAPENHQKYLAQVQTSFSVYLDAYINPPTNAWYIDPQGSTPTQRLQINTQYAADAASEYVWVYGEKYRWWATDNPNVNPQNWEDVMPGIHDALPGAIHPELMAQQKIKELEKNGKLANLLQNGDFSVTKPNTPAADKAALDLDAIEAPAHWTSWADSRGTFTQEDTVNYGNIKGGSARVTGTGNGCFIQSIDVKPGESYVVSGWIRQDGEGLGWIRVRWNRPNGWAGVLSDAMLFSSKNALDGSWRKIEGVVTVPDGAIKLVVMLSAGNQPGAQDSIWFDDIQVHKIQ